MSNFVYFLLFILPLFLFAVYQLMIKKPKTLLDSDDELNAQLIRSLKQNQKEQP
jgi:hypothetical protein